MADRALLATESKRFERLPLIFSNRVDFAAVETLEMSLDVACVCHTTENVDIVCVCHQQCVVRATLGHTLQRDELGTVLVEHEVVFSKQVYRRQIATNLVTHAIR